MPIDLANPTEESYLSQFSPDALIRASQSGALKDVPQSYLSGMPDMLGGAADKVIEGVKQNAGYLGNSVSNAADTVAPYMPSPATQTAISTVSPTMGALVSLGTGAVNSLKSNITPQYLAGIIADHIETPNLPNHGYQSFNQSGSTASGRYQVLDSTWNGRFGFSKAAFATPAQQDQFMYERMGNALRTYGGDPFKVIASHAYPAWANHPEMWNRPLPGKQSKNAQTLAAYVSAVVKGTPLQSRFNSYMNRAGE